MPKPLTFTEKLDRFPPVAVRLLARHVTGVQTARHLTGRKVHALTDAQVMNRSGLSLGEIKFLSRLTSWGAVDIDTLVAFTKGCGADLDNRNWLRKNAQYMASIRSIPRYLRQSPDWSSTFEPLIRIWIRHAQ